MNKYLKADAWCIVEEGFDPSNMRSSESVFSIGNGRFRGSVHRRAGILQVCQVKDTGQWSLPLTSLWISAF